MNETLHAFQVGGISTHGVTNDLSYFFSTGSISQWLQLTRVPHLECSNFGCAVLNNRLYVVGGCFNQVNNLICYFKVGIREYFFTIFLTYCRESG